MTPGRAVAVACAAMLAVVGCTSDDDTAEPTSFDFTEEDIQRMREMNARIGDTAIEQLDADGNVIASSRWRSDFSDAVLDVRADGCGPQDRFGSATLVDDRHAITAAHVVAGAAAVDVIDAAGDRHRAEVVLFDPDLDVAVLRTPADIGVPIGFYDGGVDAGLLGRASIARLEDGTVTVRTTQVEVLRHVEIETTDIYRERDVTRLGFEIEAAIDPGDSGAVVTIGGAAAGIIWARSTADSNRAWAVDIPDVVRDPTTRRALVEPVDTGRCSG